MSKSDQTVQDNSTIYQIFRACRLCGAGGGYKMPIIQDVVLDLDCDVELKQKIRECVQIEVSQDDKMPPLICELCVDKVNDFYEFLEMCRQTNSKTRSRLGLPPQAPQGTSDSGDCILGLTETVYSEDSPEPRSRPKPKSLKSKSEQKKIAKEEKSQVKSMNRELNNLMQVQLGNSRESRKREFRASTITNRVASRSRSSPTPTRETRQTAGDDNVSLSMLRGRSDQKKSDNAKDTTPKVILKKEKEKDQKKSDNAKDTTPKSILKKEKEKNVDDDTALLVPIVKRLRDKTEPAPVDVASKKVKITIKLPPPTKEKTINIEKVIKKEKENKVKSKAKVVKEHNCNICGQAITTAWNLSSHLKFSHTPTFTSSVLACNACGEWFETPDQISSHHKRWHKTEPYRCRWCNLSFKLLKTYNEHFDNNDCVPHPSNRQLKCTKCNKKFTSVSLKNTHKCTAKSAAPTSKRGKAGPKISKRNESTSSARKRNILDEVRVAPSIRARLRAGKVRVARCDSILRRGRCRASQVPFEFGLDPNTVYPYLTTRVRIKAEPFVADGMVSIKQEIKDELYTEEDYVHWDSDLSSDDEVDGDPKKRVDRLSTLSLKTIFSRRCLGKVPRKLRKLRTEKFDLFNEFDLSSDINNIINNLGDESVNYDSDSLLEKDTEKRVVNSDFDSVFGKNDSRNDVGDSRNDETVNSRNDETVNSQNDETVNSKNEDKQNNDDRCNSRNDESQNDRNKDNVSMGSETDASADESNYNSESKTFENESQINTDTKNVEKEITKDSDSKIEDKHTNQNGNIKENSTVTKSENNSLSDKVNGECGKKSDIETARLMDEIEAQIGSGYSDKKCEVRLDIADSKSGLESISDEEFNFDA